MMFPVYATTSLVLEKDSFTVCYLDSIVLSFITNNMFFVGWVCIASRFLSWVKDSIYHCIRNFHCPSPAPMSASPGRWILCVVFF